MLKTYRVTGPFPVAEHAPGETFAHEFTQAEEERLIDAGGICHANPAKARTGRPRTARRAANERKTDG